MSTALFVFRRDLRLADNPALNAACTAHAQVLSVFIHAPEDDGEWTAGAASHWWLHHSLATLDARLRSHHAGLHLRRGDTLDTLRELIRQSGARAHGGPGHLAAGRAGCVQTARLTMASEPESIVDTVTRLNSRMTDTKSPAIARC